MRKFTTVVDVGALNITFGDLEKKLTLGKKP